MVEESQHYTTLEPLPEETLAGARSSSAVGGGGGGVGSGGRWFVSPR